MTFQHILLPMDRTQRADAVFEAGVTAAQKYNARLTLVHCIADTGAWAMTANVPTAGVGLSWPTAILPTASAPLGRDSTIEDAIGDRLARETQVVREWLEVYQERAVQAGCKNVTCEVPMGKPSDCICKLAQERNADLVVMGRRDRSGLEEFVLGSVSNHVVHHAPCSVLVVQS